MACGGSYRFCPSKAAPGFAVESCHQAEVLPGDAEVEEVEDEVSAAVKD